MLDILLINGTIITVDEENRVINKGFVAVKDVYRTSTNGKCICFDADWLIKLDKTAIDFMLCHQLMHIALRHIYRPEFFQGEMFLIACDIVANSNLELLGWRYEKIKNVGKIYYETFFPAETGRNLTVKETIKKIPFDPASMDESKKRRYMIDSEKYWGKIIDPEKEGTFILGPDDRDIEDISDECKTGGEHLFLKKENYDDYFCEEENNDSQEHERMVCENISDAIKDLRLMKGRNSAIDSERNMALNCYSNLDWRKLLNCIISDELLDYSFLPPDRRLQDSGFFMLDFNVCSDQEKKILFWVDTSGSVDDDVLSAIYGEIYSALMIFDGKLSGMLGFFDTQVTPPIPFCSVSELLSIVPKGGGGTDFNCVFNFMQKHMREDDFSNVVIFTDGMADFPEECPIKDVQVLWLFSDKNVSASWGKWAYVDVDINHKTI